MKFLNLLDSFTKVEEAHALTAPTSRRAAFGRMGDIAVDLAKVAVPFGMAAGMSTTASAQTPAPPRTPVEVFNFALLLEHLEDEFYKRGLAANGLLTGDTRSTIEQIGKHETQHVAFLRKAITDAGGTPRPVPGANFFDFTAGGTFADVFSNRETFLAVAQAFEDTGVRAYKGQAPFLLGAGGLLTAALQIHSVEARHAAKIREIRGKQGWIPFTDGVTEGMPTFPVYKGENNVTQLKVNASATPFSGGVTEEQVTEAYDEPLTTDEVTTIASLFIR